MRHLSYALHRFESWVEPRRRYACILHAVALLLAEVAGDARRKPADRARAERCLEAMTPQELREIGCSADWGEVCQRFLREFDCADRDATTSATRLDGWRIAPPAKPPSAPRAVPESAVKYQPPPTTTAEIIFE